MPAYIQKVPSLHKAMQSKDGKYLSKYILNLLEDMNNPNSSSIPNSRKIERAAQKILTQDNNGGTNE